MTMIYDKERAWFIRGCCAVVLGAGIGGLIFGVALGFGYAAGRGSVRDRDVHETREDAEVDAGDASPNLPRVIYEKAEPYRGQNRAQYS